MRKNLTKIICLAIGLTLGLTLIAKVCSINDFDGSVPERERVCLVRLGAKTGGAKDFNYWLTTPGGVAPTLQAEMPEVEAATRFTPLSFTEDKILTNSRRELKVDIIAGDANYFKIFGTPVLIGDPVKILATKGQTMVSRSIAEKMGGMDKAIGQTFSMIDDMQTKLTVAGVFEDIPENSSVRFDIITSIECMGEWALTNWLGNERYLTYVLLRKDATADAATKTLREVVNKHIDSDELKAHGVELRYKITSLNYFLKEDASMHNQKLLMLFLGITLIVIATLNYLLIVLSTIMEKTKKIAVYKCYGASNRMLLGMTFREAATHIALALVLGLLILFAIKDTAETLLSASFATMMNVKTSALLAAICATLLAVTTIVPALIFAKVPVAAAFRTHKESKRVWKLCLLFFQFASTAFIACILAGITKQYNLMENADKGYKYDRLLVVNVAGVATTDRERIMAQLKEIPEVELVSSSFVMPFDDAGNNVYLPGQDEELFNFSDLYNVTDDYFNVWEIPVIDGKVFPSNQSNWRNVMVSREFADKLRERTGWTGSVVNRQVILTEHCNSGTDPFTIIGVFEDFKQGSANSTFSRPKAVFYTDSTQRTQPTKVLVKLHAMTAENIGAVNRFLASAYEPRTLTAEPFAMMIHEQLSKERNLRDSLIICCIVALTIAIIGLIGYTTDEVNRRRKEIAIRKVLGESVRNILAMMGRDICAIAIASLAIGAASACYLTENWLQNYPEHIDIGWQQPVAVCAALFVIIILCMVAKSWRVANENPTLGIQQE